MTASHVVRHVPLAPTANGNEREWLVTNGLGGYASGTIGGTLTRRYHANLVAAAPVPTGRVVMLNALDECLQLEDGRVFSLGARVLRSDGDTVQSLPLTAFWLDLGLPIWRFEGEGIVVERSLAMLHGQNTVLITWHLLAGAAQVELQLRPYLQFRLHDSPVREDARTPYQVISTGNHYEITGGPDLPTLRLRLLSTRTSFTLDGGRRCENIYRREAERGYDYRGTLWSPGLLRAALKDTTEVILLATTEPWDDSLASLRPADALRDERNRRAALIERADPALRDSPANELVLAADSFIIVPPRADPGDLDGRDERARTVIAGYHWFTDWGRDTMISLEGLTLHTGRHAEAARILHTFAEHIRDGLLPNLFLEHEDTGLYNTADATLWFFHAIDRYDAVTGDHDLVRSLLPKLVDIVRHHLDGTRFGIGVDPQDGLLRQGAEGYQLTWMDAKVDDWVVTPRRGKAVEINALWYNALRLLAGWVEEYQLPGPLPPLADCAERTRTSFNRRFWYADGGYLFDVVDGEHGDDPACRPNQVFAISLRHPVLDGDRWQQVLDVVEQRLLTPLGLRSLSAEHPDYKAKYDGDLRARDAAYHQGTVWAWLIGPYVDAWLKVHPERRHEVRALLDGMWAHLDDGCIGSISEIFDAEPPFAPRGCIAQAWSVAEVLRVSVA
ncbi:amylo-alpha-1,6-glucosidase [Defluviicoccus vanus]|uniref:Glycogen debranching enzyme N-terminal domain-containing protein n=1 Tax=Defluviicoccus vanus TaxID=111831 RepID=A0A7H1N0F2_9PROT|nr:amylo-alpha-1,6-glucosidase [Defluviicoccus vanus]QNT69188.1 glycogen debranching enzyme N-terminal domain-containing protein [Defluviicoccus vanus]